MLQRMSSLELKFWCLKVKIKVSLFLVPFSFFGLIFFSFYFLFNWPEVVTHLTLNVFNSCIKLYFIQTSNFIVILLAGQITAQGIKKKHF